jgi:hypothetical protein
MNKCPALPQSFSVIAFSFGDKTSGIPPGWAASPENSGMNRLEGLSQETIRRIAKMVQQVKHAGDIVIVSIHCDNNFIQKSQCGGDVKPEDVERKGCCKFCPWPLTAQGVKRVFATSTPAGGGH